MRIYKKILPSYLFFLAILIGIELCLGIFTAPAIFFPQRSLGYETLTHFQSGIIMTQIFVKFNKILILFSLLSFLMELLPLYSKAKRQNIKVILSLIILIIASVFTFYFTKNIIELQKVGEAIILDKLFIFYHKASEASFKIIVLLQSILFFFKIKELKQ